MDAGPLDAAAPDTPALDAPPPLDTPPALDTPTDTNVPREGELVFDDRGCLTRESSRATCQSPSPDGPCPALVACGWTDASQCSIDCTMTPEFGCIERGDAEGCLAAVAGGDCDAMQTSCARWLLASAPR